MDLIELHVMLWAKNLGRAIFIHQYILGCQSSSHDFNHTFLGEISQVYLKGCGKKQIPSIDRIRTKYALNFVLCHLG